jgi:hypothetical protein
VAARGARAAAGDAGKIADGRGLDQQRERSPIDQEKPGRVNLSSIIAVAACPPRATHRRCNAGYQRTAVRHSADVRRWER